MEEKKVCGFFRKISTVSFQVGGETSGSYSPYIGQESRALIIKWEIFTMKTMSTTILLVLLQQIDQIVPLEGATRDSSTLTLKPLHFLFTAALV